MSTRGFTLIEVFIVLVILSILSSVGLFKYIDFRQQAYAASVAADMSAVKLAAITAWTDSEQWPRMRDQESSRPRSELTFQVT